MHKALVISGWACEYDIYIFFWGGGGGGEGLKTLQTTLKVIMTTYKCTNPTKPQITALGENVLIASLIPGLEC